MTPALLPATGVLSWNVQNLYDTRDDEDTQDNTWLPLIAKHADMAQHWNEHCSKQSSRTYMLECMNLDWSQAMVSEKLKRIVRTINASPPVEIIALQEVENRQILNRLADMLKGEYPTRVLLSGEDARGINLGVISSLPLRGDPVLHKSGARGILQVGLGDELTVLVVHFASPRAKYYKRLRAWRDLESIAGDIDGPLVAVGDFNIPNDEDEMAQLDMFGDNWQQVCADCKGTYYYAPERKWNRLDRILLRAGSNLKWCQAGEVITQGDARPQGFSRHKGGKKFKGVSDHWPLYGKLCQEGQ